MRARRLLFVSSVIVVLAGLGYFGWHTRDTWRAWVAPPAETNHSEGAETAPVARVILTDEAIKNLRLTSAELKQDTAWRTIQVPGMIIDRPGYSDRAVAAPAAGVVTAIRHLPGETVRPGDALFELRLLGEQILQTQSDLFKAVQDIEVTEAKRKRLEAMGGNLVPAPQIIELENQVARLRTSVRGYREELRVRGLTAEQIDGITQGKEPKFVAQIGIAVPTRGVPVDSPGAAPPPAYEVQELKVDLGQQVQPGQTLCVLADHRSLSIEGRAFREETPLLERSVNEGWSVDVDFQEPDPPGWATIGREFHISHLSNTIDPVNRTFAFLMPLENQSRIVERGSNKQTLWRFRPGQKVRLHVRIEKLENVFVLPPEAVARDGPESVVFVQNVNTFERTPVRLMLRERTRVVIADDGRFPPGTYVAQSGAALLNRMAKAETSSVPKGYHMHADGSLHRNGDEEK